jgi:hypothetical protein
MRWLLILVCILLGSPIQAQGAPRLGIFGLVESVDPLVVAGQKITISDGQRVISPLGPNQSIALGDTLAIAAQIVDGHLNATRVLEIYPVVGPVSAVQGKTATVMGSAVHVPPNTSIKVGAWVALSGLWSGETVITTNTRRADAGGFGHLTGLIDEESLRLGGSDVHGAQWPDKGFGNDIWLLSGTPDDTGLNVQLMAKGVFGGTVDLALWQGYASGPVASQTYVIHGTGITGTAHDAQMPKAGALVTRCAQAGRVLQAAPDGMQLAFDLLGCARRIPVD